MTARATSASLSPASDGSVEETDAVVIGGGINGAGVARDLALRGLRVRLFERNDLAFGASGNSSGMIHGGPRYLSRSPQVTESSCRDSGFIQRIAPHLLFRIPFLMPITAGPRGRLMLELVDAYFRAYDGYQPLKRGQPHCRLTGDELRALEPGLEGEFVGGITFDEWGVDGARLCIANVLDAVERGARASVGVTVESVRTLGPDDQRGSDRRGPRYLVVARDRTTSERIHVRARVVVNATGAWGPITAVLGGLPQGTVRVRPGKGIHVVFDRRLTNYGILGTAIDGRQIFLYPWENVTLIATTDDDYYGDLDDVRATSEEVRYLIQGIAHVFPDIRLARAIGTYAAVRPSLYAYGPGEDALSREHRIVDHAPHGSPGVYSLIGGKLASYRAFAQELADRIAPRDFGVTVPCATHAAPLPGGERELDALELAAEHGITPVAARRLVFRHGTRAMRVLGPVRDRPALRNISCPCEPVLEAEVRHVVRHEFARTVDGVSRRTRLGLGACGGMRCAARCGQIVAEELALAPSAGLAMARDFLERQAWSRVVALGPEQARQEALTSAYVRTFFGESG